MKIDRLASRKPWLIRNATALVTLISVAAYLAFIQWFFGWGEILSRWQEAGWTVLALAMLLLLSTYVLRTWRIHDYFPLETGGRFRLLLRLVQVHNLLNIMMPFRSGEVSFPLLMKKEFGVSFTRASSALVVMRLLDLHALLAAAGFGLALAERSATAWLLWLLFALAPGPGFLLRRPLLRLLRAGLGGRLQTILDEVEAGLPASLPAFLRAWGATLLNWAVKVAVLAWVLVLLADLKLGPAFGGALGGELSSVLPVHAPGGVGTYPAGITAGALGLGADHTEAAIARLAKAAVNAHLLVIVSSVVGTLLAMLVAGRRAEH
ncbi:lysylphosphatidylglycerol synthase domain-containing protein [Rhizobium sp. SSA_523]|uniref:lysylphosphatidylglycerol synthase domain-containing protein n=1 Tax=Rhizobium sp. SSA_523 TaxID=2952477 RepID=UPI0020914703|nr:lysylphosphatidylglycerol synthase domain-containing protein [Rhizobium sp. SSA_523]MCO5730862.1 flippase-like domain-containing protein [Rhizobium sp. SSA_523]WKC24319.1 lysylphosphatidylglycerol synthase domain-containing protein [Rhizobium sp. SSA_523]